jgi:hypothetical protein
MQSQDVGGQRLPLSRTGRFWWRCSRPPHPGRDRVDPALARW